MGAQTMGVDRLHLHLFRLPCNSSGFGADDRNDHILKLNRHGCEVNVYSRRMCGILKYLSVSLSICILRYILKLFIFSPF